MAIHFQLLFATILYGVVAINSIIEFSTLAYSKSDIGFCYLYVKDKDTKPSTLLCSSNIYIYGGASAYALVMTIYHGYGTVVASRESHIGRTMWVMPWLLLNALVMTSMFICSCIYSIGLYITCSHVSPVYDQTDSCSLKNKKFKTMVVAEVSAWLNVLLWCGLIAIEAIRLRRNRRAVARELYVDPSTSDVVKIGDIVPSA